MNRYINSYNMVSLSALVGMLIDGHLYIPYYEIEVTSIGLIVGAVIFVWGIVLHKQEEDEKKEER